MPTGDLSGWQSKDFWRTRNSNDGKIVHSAAPGRIICRGLRCVFVPLRYNSKSPLQSIKNYGGLLVEMRGVEPLSENPSTRLSTGVVPDQISRCQRPGTNSGNGSHLMHDRFNGETPVHGYHFMTLTPGSWSSPANGRRYAPRRGLRRQSNRIVVV